MKFLKTILITLSIINNSFAHYTTNFSHFIDYYNKSYSSIDEYNQREHVFYNNNIIIENHNNRNLSWKLKINKFGDMNHIEFNKKYLNNIKYTKNKKSITKNKNNIILPSSLDWVSKGAVTPIKNQGSCGSCWAFSTTGAIDGLHFIKTGKLKSFSEQQLVDCSTNNNGCNGGLMDNAFDWIVKNRGICLENDYNYAGINENCKNCTNYFNISGYKDVIPNNETDLQYSLYKQPISIAIEADQNSFQFYSSGVFTGDCGYSLDHGVLIVGWGRENNTDYWKIKNSWGEDWGDKGYILLERNIKDSRGKCGLAIQPSYPI